MHFLPQQLKSNLRQPKCLHLGCNNISLFQKEIRKDIKLNAMLKESKIDPEDLS